MNYLEFLFFLMAFVLLAFLGYQVVRLWISKPQSVHPIRQGGKLKAGNYK
jgi:hypothetical protein